ncbi:MAG: sigma 54-interacting transcriptional regulator [Eubacterium ramulus]
MSAAITLARTAADSSSNVLILGESGTGKELFAQAIHNASNRADFPLCSH